MGDLGTIAGIVVLAVLVLPCVLIPFVERWRSAELRQVQRWAAVGYSLLAVAVVLVAVAGFPAYVFAIAMVLNLTLGRTETVPFSTFPMYAQPRNEGINVHVVELADGAPVKTGIVFDVPPSSVLKLYRHELRSLGGSSSRIDEALVIERQAGRALLERLLEAQARAGRESRLTDVRIELEVFAVEGHQITAVRHHLAEYRPDPDAP